MAPSEPEHHLLGVSTGGNRKRHHALDTIQQTTERVLKRVDNQSVFFDQCQPIPLPKFQTSEIQMGDLLGRGEFGDVSEIVAIQIEFDCPCTTCGDPPESPLSHPLSVPPKDRIASPQPHQDPDQKTSPVQIVIDETKEPRKESPPGPISMSKPPSALLTTTGIGNHHLQQQQHRRTTSAVSFAEHVVNKPSPDLDVDPHVDTSRSTTMHTDEDHQQSNNSSDNIFIHDDNSDNSSLSTDDVDHDEEDEEESVSKMLQEEDIDSEVPFLRVYMSTHVTRQGMARYAIKRARQDLKNHETLLEAVVDMAVEAKFLASIRHPNIVKMRGTVGTPGTLDFMIIMDRLKMTLRQKMRQWNDESKGNGGILAKLLRKGNRAMMQRDQYADKVLAVFDIARAMRYLHNHMIIYRDLKPENIAFDVRGDMRLFDFGLAKELKARDLVDPPDGFKATGLTGSRRYMAPEVCSCKNYGLKVDVYSFAILFWEVFSGQDAYQKMSFDRHFDHVVINNKRPNPKAAAITTRNLSTSLLHLMSEMWHPNPKDRPTFRNICDRLAGECILSSNQRSRTLDGESNKDSSNRSHQSQLTDRTRYLMNRSVQSRYADLESNDSVMGSTMHLPENHRS